MKTNYQKIKIWRAMCCSMLFGGAVFASQAQIVEQSSFETYSVGTNFDDTQWEGEGFSPEWVSGLETRSEIDDDFAHSGSKSLKVKYPKDKYGTNNSGGQTKLNIQSKDEYYLSYWVRFDENFSWGNKKEGGKLPGLAAGDICSGGSTCNGNNGFTARYMWRGDGRATLYLYHMDKPDNDGEYFQLKKSDGSNVHFERGEWIHLVQRVKINTVSGGNANANGEIQIWVNNEEVLDIDGLRFVDNSDKIDVLYFSTFHGGGNSDWAPTRDSYTWFDDFLVTTDFDDIWSTTDTDNDNVPDQIDGCPTDPNKTATGLCGCFVEEGTCQDCNGTANGTAYTDFCGNCVGGVTGLPECTDGNLYTDQFDDEIVSVSGTNLVKVTASETECEELKVEDASLGTFDPIYLEFPTPLNITANPRITARVRSTDEVNLRFDLRDINGKVSNGSNGRVSRLVSGDDQLWEELTFDYSEAAFTDNAMDKTNIESIAIMFDPGTAGFTGEIYFDYIVAGNPLNENNSTCIDGLGSEDCNGDPNGTAYFDDCEICVGGNTGKVDCNANSIYEEQFDDQVLSLSGLNLSKVNAFETGCQEVSIEDVSLTNFDPIYLQFPTPIDVTPNMQVVVRARSSHSVSLRLDLRDLAGMSTNGSNGRVSNLLTADSTTWREYTYTYTEAAFTDNAVDKTQIDRIAIMFDAGSPGFTGKIYMDFIAVGDPTGQGNATDWCTPGFDCHGEQNGQAFVDGCNVCAGGNTGVTPNDCVTANDDYFDLSSMALYPNPTKGIVHLTTSANWVLYDLTSQKVAEGEGDIVDLSSFARGVYFIHIEESVLRVVRK